MIQPTLVAVDVDSSIYSRAGCPGPNQGSPVRTIYLFSIVTIGISLFAAVHDEKMVATLDKSESYLYDHSNHARHYIPAKGNFLAHRVYIRYDRELHTWCYLKSDFSRRLSNPIEYLRPDTVTLGKVIGAKLGLQRFRLADNGNWTPTRDKEIYLVWAKTDPPTIRAFVYQNPGDKTEKPKPKAQIPTLRVPTEVPQRSQQ